MYGVIHLPRLEKTTARAVFVSRVSGRCRGLAYVPGGGDVFEVKM